MMPCQNRAPISAGLIMNLHARVTSVERHDGLKRIIVEAAGGPLHTGEIGRDVLVGEDAPARSNTQTAL
jgi:hypothetical protein